MPTLKEISIQSVGEPYSIKIERNSKGYNYEISVKAEDSTAALVEVLEMRKKLEEELYGAGVKDEK